jgi:hypothetical protein
MQPGVYTHLTGDQYHAAPGISNSGLSVLAERTPAHYIAYKNEPRVETPAKATGKRLHFALLEPHEFERLYAPIEKFDLRTNIGKAGKAAWEAANVGRLPIDPGERDQVLRIRDRLHADPAVRELLDGGRKERSVFALDPVTGVLVKCRPDNDKIISGRRIITDIKSTDNASPEDFMWSAYRYGYFRQAPFYSDVCDWEAINDALEQPVDEFRFIAFEKDAPFGHIIYEAAPRFLSRGRDAYRSALNIYATCVATDTWPCYENEVHTLDLPEAIHKRMDMADSDLVENISYV